MYRAATLLAVFAVTSVFPWYVQAQQAEMSLVTREAMQEELKLTPEQKEQFVSIAAEYREAVTTAMRELLSTSRGMSETDRRQRIIDARQKAILPIAAEHYEKLKAVLKPEQMRRLKEVAIQYTSLGSLLVNNPGIAKQLGLSDDQKERIADAFFNAVGVRAASGTLQERSEQVLAILTDDQRSSLESMKGKPFDIAKLRITRTQGPPPFGFFLERNDKNSDGKITKSEALERFWNTYGNFDANKDDAVDKDEFAKGMAERAQGQRFGGRGGGAQRRPPRAPWMEKFGEGGRLLREGREEEAKQAYSEAAKILSTIPEKDRNAADWGYLGQALYRAGQPEEARKALEKSLELRSDRTPTSRSGPRWWYMAMILAQTGNEQKAQEYYDVLFAEMKANPSLRRNNDRYRNELEEMLSIAPKPLPDIPASSASSRFGQRNDPDFQPSVKSPRFKETNAPTVAIDEGHRNFHTMDGRFLPFAQVLQADGCKVVAHGGAFTTESLERIDVLVIANALPSSTSGPEVGSAFSKEEIELLLEWVSDGGSLMLLADHRPYGEAAKQLGAAFGVEMSGGFVLDDDEQRGRIVFSRENRLLAAHPITEGTTTDERITTIMSFAGQALRLPASFTPLMSLAEGTVRYPDRQSSASGREPKDVSDWHQGAVAQVGQGRVAFFGEAGMFSAQVAGPNMKFGMNAAGAEQNQRFLLNVVHWLTSD